eukprot:TRINITY_DN7057_c0_g1_i1.p1 TRINITY_DN7057_c0_g1~~TRINITY_DN7057_c0_g1_i1.p1  ORF type:complete len:763 (+),score=225.67 TRINITY_DN7057_c0_g1_i1:44-2332(+)
MNIKEEPKEGHNNNNGHTSASSVPISSHLQHSGKLKRADQERIQKMDLAEQKVEVDKYDTESWTLLIMESQNLPIDRARDVYNKFLKIFPTAGRYWKQYAEHELSSKNYDKVAEVYKSCLLTCLNIDLWRSYLSYIRSINDENTPQGKAEVKKAFEFVLNHVKLDISSTQIWQDYIQFLKYEQVGVVRKAYHQALENPMHNIDLIYKDYEAWENSMSKTLATALLQERGPKYANAKVVYRERKALMDGILRNMIARPPRGSLKEEHQVRLWRRLLTFEKGNPQRLDPNLLKTRVIFTYSQCVLCLYHYADIWIEFANYVMESSGVEAAAKVYDRASSALPNNLLLHFAYADFNEMNKRSTQAKEVFEKLLQNPSPDPLVYVQYMRFARRTEGVEGPRKVFKRARTGPSCSYEIFVALAHIEAYVNKNPKIAREVFEGGLKRFGESMPFVKEYLTFMKQLNEDNNTRALYERILITFPKEKSLPIWTDFTNFEYTSGGDIESITKVEKRRTTAHPETDPTGVFSLVERYKFLDLWPSTDKEIESFAWTAPPVHVDDLDESSSYISGGGVKKTRVTRPDLSTMILYKPDSLTNPDMPVNMDTGLVPPIGQNGPIGMPGVPPGVGVPPQGVGMPGVGGVGMPHPFSMPPQGGVQQQQGIGGAPVFLANPPPLPPLPDFLIPLVSILPPPHLYIGPIPDPEAVIGLLRDINLTRPSSPERGGRNKRKLEEDSDDEIEEKMPVGHNKNPNDVYRNRQAARLSKMPKM